MLTGRCESSPPKAGHHADGQVQRHRLLRPSVGMLGISLAESGIEVCAGTLTRPSRSSRPTGSSTIGIAC